MATCTVRLTIEDISLPDDLDEEDEAAVEAALKAIEEMSPELLLKEGIVSVDSVDID